MLDPRSQEGADQPQPLDLNDPVSRGRFSASGFRGFVSTADYLRLTVQERLRLLGDLPAATYHRWSARGAPALSRDQLERISLLLGSVKALRLLFTDDEYGRQWLRAANGDHPFNGDSPLAFVLRGSIDHLYALRRYLDAWRGVWP